MNIYATGMNPADSNALKREPRVHLFQAFVEMMKYLKSQEHKVTWKATKVGDDIPGNTDVVMVSSMLPRSLNCPYALGVIWTISEALRRNIPLVLYLTDWAFFRANGEFKSIAKAGEEYFFKTIGGAPQYNEDPNKLRYNAADLLDVCHQYGDPKSKLWKTAQVLVPKYTNWGDIQLVRSFLLTTKPVLTIDPTPIFLNYLNDDPNPFEIESLGSRTKKWILPSLLKDDTWIDKQHLQWPIERFGPKGFTVLPDEHYIQHAYGGSVGALCPPYPHEGSGWWRSRWIHSARACSILLCGDKDAKAVGVGYGFEGKYYESVSEYQLENIAQWQRETMDKLLQLDMELLQHQIYTAIVKART